jgi:hypothetical protein
MDQLKPLVRNRLTRKIFSFSAGKDDLGKFFHVLQERSSAAAELEIANFKQKDQPDEIYEQNKKTIKEGFEIKLTVTSFDGQELWGVVKDIFDSVNFPDLVKSIYINSEIPLKSSYNYYVRNSFELLLDFSKPELFNMSFLPSQETPNASNITVQGYDATWVHGLYHEISGFIEKQPSRFKWIHKHSIYDFLVWVIGLPIGFWATYKLSNIIDAIFGTYSGFVQNASYVYVFLVTLTIFRLLFHYARWVWPLVEYRSSSNIAQKHRITFGIITLGLVTAFIYDILKALL